MDGFTSKIRKGFYGLPQVGMLVNNLLRKRIGRAGYYEAVTAPGLWLNKWRLIIFYLIVYNFGIDFVEKHHAKHPLSDLEEHFTITTEWEGNK